jgi:hypothetical protein
MFLFRLKQAAMLMDVHAFTSGNGFLICRELALLVPNTLPILVDVNLVEKD